MKKTLLDLDAELEEIDRLIDSIETEDIPPELEEAVADLFDRKEETEEKYFSKLDNIVALIETRKHWIKIRKAEAERLNKLAKTDENTVKWLSSYLMKHFQNKKTNKLRTKRFNLSLVNNGGKKPLIIKDNIKPEDISEKYHRVTVSIDKNAIRESLEKGENLDFAYLEERGQHLRIK